jgi:hypothetical protein
VCLLRPASVGGGGVDALGAGAGRDVMELSLVFWIVFLLCFCFSYWSGYPYPAGHRPFAPWFAVFVLIFLLGWRVFGFVIRG